jgi:hypothetical protein
MARGSNPLCATHSFSLYARGHGPVKPPHAIDMTCGTHTPGAYRILPHEPRPPRAWSSPVISASVNELTASWPQKRTRGPLLLLVRAFFPAATRKPCHHRGQLTRARIRPQPGHQRLVLIPEKLFVVSAGRIGNWGRGNCSSGFLVAADPPILVAGLHRRQRTLVCCTVKFG